MKKSLIALSLMLLGAATLQASPYTYFEQNKYYFQVNGSYDVLTNSDLNTLGGKLENDNGFGVSAAVGKYFDPLRVELEYSYRANNTSLLLNGLPTASSGDLTHNSMLVNVVYEAPLGDVMFVYLGAGMGVSFVNLELAGTDDTDVVFAYQAMFGFGYKVTRQMSIIAGYRFFRTLETDHAGLSVDPTSINAFEMGLKVDF